MYTKEEARLIRSGFWEQFRAYTHNRRKNKGRTGVWILDKTGINALNLRFHFDNEQALVGIDLETKNMDKRIELYDKLETLRKQINIALGENTKWELEYVRENNKTISRIYTNIEGVDIFDKTTWNRVNMFFFDRMTALEDVYLEYKDFLR
ncbi:MAG: DUF4268 domain-containing protein [Bacteroidales bacterium]